MPETDERQKEIIDGIAEEMRPLGRPVRAYVEAEAWRTLSHDRGVAVTTALMADLEERVVALEHRWIDLDGIGGL